MTNNLRHWRAGMKTNLLSLGFGYHQIQITGLELLQGCGHQIRVNTSTGSYEVGHDAVHGVFTLAILSHSTHCYN